MPLAQSDMECDAAEKEDCAANFAEMVRRAKASRGFVYFAEVFGGPAFTENPNKTWSESEMQGRHAELKVHLKAHMHDDLTVDSALQALFCYKENLSECNLEQIEEDMRAYMSRIAWWRENSANFERWARLNFSHEKVAQCCCSISKKICRLPIVLYQPDGNAYFTVEKAGLRIESHIMYDISVVENLVRSSNVAPADSKKKGMLLSALQRAHLTCATTIADLIFHWKCMYAQHRKDVAYLRDSLWFVECGILEHAEAARLAPYVRSLAHDSLYTVKTGLFLDNGELNPAFSEAD